MLRSSDRDSRRAAMSWAGPALGAGALGGAVKIGYLMMAAWVLGAGFFTPANLAGATFAAFRPPLAEFAGPATILGMGLHVAVCAVWGLMFGAVVMTRPKRLRSTADAVLAGLALGLVFEGVAFLTGPFFNPYAAGINPLLGFLPPLVGNLLFGLVTALALRAWLGRTTVLISLAPEARTPAEDRTLR